MADIRELAKTARETEIVERIYDDHYEIMHSPPTDYWTYMEGAYVEEFDELKTLMKREGLWSTDGYAEIDTQPWDETFDEWHQ